MMCLPDKLKAEISIRVHLDTLKRVDIFRNTEAGFLRELVLRLRPVLFSPGDYVCRKDEVGHEMYIVSKGILEVVASDEFSVVATLRAGSYFGEISVLNVGQRGNRRTASVKSVGYSDLLSLNKQDLWEVLKNYPSAEMRIRARAEERLSKLEPISGSHFEPASSQGFHRRRVCSSGSQQRHNYPQAGFHYPCQLSHQEELGEALMQRDCRRASLRRCCRWSPSHQLPGKSRAHRHQVHHRQHHLSQQHSRQSAESRTARRTCRGKSEQSIIHKGDGNN